MKKNIIHELENHLINNFDMLDHNQIESITNLVESFIKENLHFSENTLNDYREYVKGPSFSVSYWQGRTHAFKNLLGIN